MSANCSQLSDDGHRLPPSQPSDSPFVVPCSCECRTEAGPAGDIVVLRIVGEIDIATIPVVQDALTVAVDQRPADVVVDLAGVIFCCVRGFALLAGSAHSAQADGIDFAVSGLPPHLDRLATLLWAERGCVRYRSAAAAVTTIRIGHLHRPG